MKIFRVIFEGPDGPSKRKKGGGGREQPLRREEHLYAASSFERVWAQVQESLRTNLAGLDMELLKIEEAAPAVFILEDEPGE